MSQPFKSIASSWCEAAQAVAIQRHGLTALQAMPRHEREAAIIAAGPAEMTLYAAPRSPNKHPRPSYRNPYAK